MRPLAAAVVQDVFVVATCILKGVGQDRHPVEGTLGVDAFGECGHVRSQPSGIDGHRAEGVTNDLTQEVGFDSSDNGLVESSRLLQ